MEMRIIFLIIFLACLKAHSLCPESIHQEQDWKDYEDIMQLVCDDAPVNCQLYLAKIHQDWARVLVDSSIIYYLHKYIHTGHWVIVASGRKFDVSDWQKLQIPESIR
jgi:hypothetical protein